MQAAPKEKPSTVTETDMAWCNENDLVPRAILLQLLLAQITFVEAESEQNGDLASKTRNDPQSHRTLPSVRMLGPRNSSWPPLPACLGTGDRRLSGQM